MVDNKLSSQTRSYNPENYKDGDELTFWKQISGIEFVLVILSIILLIGAVIFGYISQNAKNRDQQRFLDFSKTIIPAVQDFYKNSSATESARFYPISQCSGDLNEVDFEYSLRQNLTGELNEVDNHTYIDKGSFPKDRSGQYSTNFKSRAVPYRCPEKLNFSTTQNNTAIYADNYPSCSFSKAKLLKQCYLYTTSAIGDGYQLGYFNESTNCFTLFREFRNQGVTSVNSCS